MYTFCSVHSSRSTLICTKIDVKWDGREEKIALSTKEMLGERKNSTQTHILVQKSAPNAQMEEKKMKNYKLN